jgi:hypothetical protein
MSIELTKIEPKVQNPADRLSRLILAYTGVLLPPAEIKKVLRADFKRVSAYAHQIHEEQV